MVGGPPADGEKGVGQTLCRAALEGAYRGALTFIYGQFIVRLVRALVGVTPADAR